MPKKKNEVDREQEREEKAKKKQMDEVAKHLRFNVPTKNAIIKGQKVEYFVGCKAVDCLMTSRWNKEPIKDPESNTPHFATRTDAKKYCTTLLLCGYFVRANKVEVKPKGGGSKELPSKEQGETRKRRETKPTDSPRAKKQEKEEQGDNGKKKKKYRLEVHINQTTFQDSEDVFFWRYDPPSRGTYIIGFAVVLGAIAVTLQPLWPDSTRVGFWYLNMGMLGLVGILVGCIVARWFLFGLILIITIGKVHFWIFPNLENEKCGFFESFKPFYSIEGPSETEKKRSKHKKRAEEKAELETEDTAETDDAQQSPSEDTQSEKTAETAA